MKWSKKVMSVLAISSLLFILCSTAQAQGTCYTGKPLEFKLNYQCTPYHGKFKISMSWIHKPYKIPIGKGFYLEQGGLDYYYTNYLDYYTDLSLLLTGPGLPKKGKKVTFKWGKASCISGKGNVDCRQFLNTEIVKIKSGSSTFSVEFYSGYSEQPYNEGLNVATWRICYGGPFEQVILEPIPKNWWNILTELNIQVKEILDESIKCWKYPWHPDCLRIPTKYAKKIGKAALELKDLPVPEEEEALRWQIIENIVNNDALMKEIESLWNRANEETSEAEELQAAAKEYLNRALERMEELAELLSRLEEALEQKFER